MSVVMPFAGTRSAAAAALNMLAALHTGRAIPPFIDNARAPVTGAPEAVTVIRAVAESSPAYARNAGAERAGNDWILFLDADTGRRPSYSTSTSPPRRPVTMWPRSRARSWRPAPPRASPSATGPRVGSSARRPTWRIRTPARRRGEPARPPRRVLADRRLLRGGTGRPRTPTSAGASSRRGGGSSCGPTRGSSTRTGAPSAICAASGGATPPAGRGSVAAMTASRPSRRCGVCSGGSADGLRPGPGPGPGLGWV